MQQNTLSILKPDALRRGLVGKAISYLESNGLKVEQMRLVNLSRQKAEEFYSEHKAKEFFPGLVSHITSGPVVLLILSGEDAVKRLRKIMGSTNPKEADKGTIRGDLAESIDENLIHGADSEASATRETSLLLECF